MKRKSEMHKSKIGRAVVALLSLCLCASVANAQTRTQATLELGQSWTGSQDFKTANQERHASQFSGSDWCARIQAAHDDLPSTGGVIKMDFAGTQTCTTTITITKPVLLQGMGIANSILSYTPTSGTAITVDVDSTGIYDRQKVAVLQDFALTGPGSGTPKGILVSDGPGWTIQRVKVSAFQDGITANGSSGAGTNTNLGVLEGVESRSNTRYGVLLTGNGTELTSCLASDASANLIGWQIESGLGQFFGCSAYLNTSMDVLFTGSLASLNRGLFYLDQSGADGSLHFESSASYNEIYTIGGTPNEAHPIYNISGADGGGKELNGTFRREPYFKDPTGSARAAIFAANVFAVAGANAGTHIGMTGLGQVVASNTQNLTGSVIGVRGTVTGVAAGAGTLSNGMALQATASYNGGPVTTHYGLRVEAPSGSVTPGTKYGVFTAAGAGKARLDDGVRAGLVETLTNCSDSAGDAACSAAPAGSVVIDAADTTTVVSTTAVTASSQIILQEDSSLGARLSVTCNTTTGRDYTVTARTAATSFTITASAAPTTNPACLSFFIVN